MISIALGDILRKATSDVLLEPNARYRQVTVKLWGKGVVQRDEVLGSDIGSERRRQVHRDQLIFSKIDARNGAVGIVPESLDGAVVSNDFPVFDIDTDKCLPSFMDWLVRTPQFVELCRRGSEGTTNRKRLREERLMSFVIRLPSTNEQQATVARLQRLRASVAAAHKLGGQLRSEEHLLLLGAYNEIAASSPRANLGSVATLTKRPVTVDPTADYIEIGIRSFGRGTFHKAPTTGLALSDKKLFRISKGDLLFNIVFAWEGAVAIAQSQDDGLVGSHRFLTFVPNGSVRARFLRFHFLTPDGLASVRKASPGGAGRNRTLSRRGAEQLGVVVPDERRQVWFEMLMDRVEGLSRLGYKAASDADAVIASFASRCLERCFSA